MSDESLNLPAAEVAPESGNTAVPETVEHEAPGENTEVPEPKTFTQDELDAILGKRLAKERRAWEREQTKAVAPPVAPVTEAPKPEQFKTVEEYFEALADHKAEQKVAQREQQKQQAKADAAFGDREEAAREKYDDFDIVYQQPENGGPRITPEMAQVIKESEIGPDIAYHLAKNRAESIRIAGLSPLQQAREIGKIEATLASNPPVKKVSSAPEPIKPVGSRSTTPTYDPTDSRSVKSMSTSDWIEARNKQLRAKA